MILWNFLYRTVLRAFRIRIDFRLNARDKIGVCPYPRRSPFLLTLINFQQLTRFLTSPRPTKTQLSGTKNLKNSKIGKTALVLGGGPSLGKLNIDRVKSDNPDIWVVNSFALSNAAKTLSPNYYVLSDVFYFNRNYLLEPVMKILDVQNSTLVLPHWLTKDFPKHDTLNLKHIFFDDRELSAWSRNTSPLKARGYLSLTLYKALAFAIFMGYEKIYILGADNTEFLGYTSDISNRFLFGGVYDYEDPNGMVDVSHDFLDGPAGAFIDVAHALADLYKFKGPIINLDTKSLTTAFPKVENHPWILA
jgi:hypothetical protein